MLGDLEKARCMMKASLNNEEGMALVITLLLLVLLTVMGLAAISNTSSEIQLTANDRTDMQAFHSAEAGIVEAIYRSTLQVDGTQTIADGGSYVNVDDITFDAGIVDPAMAAGSPDPDWETNIYFSGVEPSDVGKVRNTRTILASSDWNKLQYSGDDTDPDTAPVNVRYLKEDDLQKWGFPGADMNGDGDLLDLVYYDSTNKVRQPPAGPGENGTADATPPTDPNLVIRLITAQGRRGNAVKRIRRETTGMAADPQISAAIRSDVPLLEFGGGAFVSGYNHSADTTKSDENNHDSTLHENNGCDNYSESGGDGNCQVAYQPPGMDPDLGKESDYSGKASENSDHKPGIVSNGDIETKGNSEIWGGTDDGTEGWSAAPETPFPNLAQMLGMSQEDVESMLDGANTDPNACPTGLTYIESGSGQSYEPSRNCPAGAGILVVKGDMNLTSQFEFRGLIYIEGKLNMTGGSWVLGAIAVKDNSDSLKISGGSSTVLYSKTTVDAVVSGTIDAQGFATTTLSWREF